MGRNFTVSEAAKYLGVESAEIEKLVSTGELIPDKNENEPRIEEHQLLKAKLVLKKRASKSKNGSLINDTGFIEYFEDYINMKFLELSSRLDGAYASGSPFEKMLDKKLDHQSEILRFVKLIDGKVSSNTDKIIKAIDNIRKDNPAAEIKNRMEAFIAYMNKMLNERISAMKQEQSELSEQIASLGSAKSGINSDKADNSAIIKAIKSLEESQGKVRSIVDANFGFQKNLHTSLEEIKLFMESPSGRFEEIEKLLPELRELVGVRLKQVAEISNTVKTLKDNFTLEGQGYLLDRLEEVQKSITGSDLGRLIPSLDEKLKDYKKSVEQIVTQQSSRQQKALSDKLEALISPAGTVFNADIALKELEKSVAGLSEHIEGRFKKLEETIRKVKGGDRAKKGDGSGILDAVVIIDEKLLKIEDLINNFSERFDPASLKAVTDSIDGLGKNINKKLDQLDRLNELVGLHDRVDDIAEQMQAFEAIMADVNQLVDERLRSLSEINANLTSMGLGSSGGENSRQLMQRLGDVRSLLEAMNNRFSIDTLLPDLKSIIVEHTDDLRNNQEVIRKMLVELNFSQQEWILEKLEELNAGLSTTGGARESVKAFDRVPLAISDTLETRINQLEKLGESIDYLAEQLRLDHEQNALYLSQAVDQITGDFFEKFELMQAGIAQIRASFDPANIISAMTPVVIEGNEKLLGSQQAVVNYLQKNHDEILQYLNTTGVLPGLRKELMPILEQVLDEQVVGFKRDIENAHKVLVNLNVNIQKQMLIKIKEMLTASGALSVPGAASLAPDSKAIVNAIEYILEEKLADLKENQEALLSVNLNTQKTLKERLDGLTTGHAELPQSTNRLSSGDGSLIPVIESIITEKMKELRDTYLQAHQAYEKLNGTNQAVILDKLGEISKNLHCLEDFSDMSNYLPAIGEVLQDTCDYLNSFREEVDVIKRNIQLQDPQYLGLQFEELKKSICASPTGGNISGKLESVIAESLSNHKENFDLINDRLEYIYEMIEKVIDHSGNGGDSSVKDYFAVKIEETRELEKQLVHTFRQMQSIFRRENMPALSGTDQVSGSAISDIIHSIEDARHEQEKLSLKIDRISDLLSKAPDSKTLVSRDIPAQGYDLPAEQLKTEVARMRQLNEGLKRENSNLLNQIKVSQATVAVDSKNGDQVQVLMHEKDRLLEECYKEKLELREVIEKERRDKYEMIQKYETEKKELVDSLAMERIQREKDRVELEYLRNDARKKKWW